jgi:hypothetical protein
MNDQNHTEQDDNDRGVNEHQHHNKLQFNQDT